MKRPALERHRIWLAALVLAVTLIVGWWMNRATQPEAPPPPAAAPGPAPAAVPAPRPAPPPAPPPATPLPPAQHAAATPPAPDKPVDVFAVHTWEPPPPPPTAAAQAAPPQAPALPFRFMGRIAEPGAAPVFLLVQGDRVLPVKLGQRVGGAYRLEKFEGGQLFFRYQPMNVVQTLPAGGAP